MAPETSAMKRPARMSLGPEEDSDPGEVDENPWAHLLPGTSKKAATPKQAAAASSSSAPSDDVEREKAARIKRELDDFRLRLARTCPVEKATSSGSHLVETVVAEPAPVPLITSKLTSSGSQSVETTGQQSIGELYKWKGKTYREGRKGTGVCTSHSLDDIQEYMSECPLNTLDAKFADEVPFESVEDWVTTIRQACTAPGAAFFWPSEKLSFQRALAVALAHLPPGCFITIRSAKPLPQRLKCTTSPSGLAYYVQELYHGTCP